MLHNVIDAQAATDLQILLVVAGCLLTSPYIAKFLKLPLSATEIILGSLIGFLGFIGESENFKLLANAGFYYLMFIAGMEINLKTFLNTEKTLLNKAFIYIASLYLFSILAVESMNISYIFVIIIPIMSVGLLSTLYRDFGKNCNWLNISMIVATLAEVVSIVLLTITAAFLGQGTDLFSLTQNLLYLVGFLALCIFGFKFLEVLFWWYPQLKTILMPWQDHNEKDIRFCMAIFIAIVAIMIYFKLEVALGAFIAGSFIATFFDHKKDLEHKLSSFGYGFLIPIFFIYIGSSFKLEKLLNPEVLIIAFSLTAFMIFVRIASAMVFLKNLGLKNTFLFGLSHSMPLTLLIAIATLSLGAKIISEEIYSGLVLTALLEAILAISLIKFINNFKRL
ncbi:sodium/hydrogen exchanger family protein [Campylobacter volucris]|uniref:Sodium/hydrogen exchanger family protein n=1 Tax=Campylobacter volucris TaxID=1031542 RepID=A0AAE6D038_9BACT|nr:sodium/hydrogen exchanger family protein [Campylobacter volucris]AJC93499.1 Na+/H+ exchanger family protein [Campylobacter volucris LMG 24379]KAB0579216.1 sodium/hydrogen exchanger family protein [Campylobacter volucris]MBF7046600.1 sodium/hydrogen exchanger family protein [Campylobacter volucris]MBF7068759.1 sodium/hydrogen exchanger family protein [Campylobacter volucris]QBL14110.1 sodium/hydrogen exchanger family protein [Campylobacter volucris]